MLSAPNAAFREESPCCFGGLVLTLTGSSQALHTVPCARVCIAVWHTCEGLSDFTSWRSPCSVATQSGASPPADTIPRRAQPRKPRHTLGNATKCSALWQLTPTCRGDSGLSTRGWRQGCGTDGCSGDGGDGSAEREMSLRVFTRGQKLQQKEASVHERPRRNTSHRRAESRDCPHGAPSWGNSAP